MKRQIAVSRADRHFLMKAFNVTERTVFNALALEKPATDLRKKIRKVAMERGGVLMVTLPAMETFHDTAEGIMRQYLPNGAILEFWREDGTGHIFFKGEEVARYSNVDVPMIYKIQKEAAALR